LKTSINCPKCRRWNASLACPNCQYRGGYDVMWPQPIGTVRCTNCEARIFQWDCQHGCGAMIPLSLLRKDEKCIIVTEIYGAESVQAAILRRFRDQVLLRSRLGVRFVDGYYHVGPAAIPLIRRSRLVRASFQSIVDLLVLAVRGASWGDHARPSGTLKRGRL